MTNNNNKSPFNDILNFPSPLPNSVVGKFINNKFAKDTKALDDAHAAQEKARMKEESRQSRNKMLDRWSKEIDNRMESRDRPSGATNNITNKSPAYLTNKLSFQDSVSGMSMRNGGSFASSIISDNKGSDLQSFLRGPKLQVTSTGIKSGTLVQDIQRATDDYTPLMMVTNTIGIFGQQDQSSECYRYVSTVVYPYILNAVKTRLNFDVTFTLEQFMTAYDNILDGLYLFYSIESVLGYVENDANRNVALIAIRNSLTSDIILAQRRLGETLAKMAIPTPMLKLVMWLCSNYCSSMNPTSMMYKSSHKYSLVLGSPDFITAAKITTIIATLNNTDTINVESKIKRAVPDWSRPSLPLLDCNPKYDAQFATYICNTPITARPSLTGDRFFHPNTISQSAITYALASNKLDGMTYALSTIFTAASSSSSTNDGDPSPSIIKAYFDSTPALKSYTSNRFSFNGLYMVDSNSGVGHNSGFVYSIWSKLDENPIPNVFFVGVPFGFQRLQEHTVGNTRSAVNKYLDTLFDIRYVTRK